MLYNLFEWPGRKNSRLAVIGVANTMDLPERLLQRIASRLAGRRLNFHPYTRAQLSAILSQRLAHLAPLFEPNALDYACRKVSSSGTCLPPGADLFPFPLFAWQTEMEKALHQDHRDNW